VSRAGGSRLLPPPQRDWAYFFDIDGTLVDFADAPGGARPDAALRSLIAELHRAAGGAVALISGRAIPDIDALMDGVHLPAAGQHGTERRDAAGRITHHAAPVDQLDWAHDRLAEAAARHAGLLLEHKGLSLALHYRRAPRLAGYAHKLVRSLAPRLGGQYCIQRGKRIVELKPAGKDKGAAVLEFMEEPPFKGRTAVFVGDDLTDEYGFATVNRLGGHSIKVGPGRTAARFRLRDVASVRAWLAQAVRPPR
jgi:trehalose 6-phosphate phosphatase